jgi:hypothetical protein
MRIVSLLCVGVVSCAIAGTVRAAEPAAPGSADGASTQAVSSAPSTEPSALGPMGYDAKGQRGRVHTVVTGDTLWDLSRTVRKRSRGEAWAMNCSMRIGRGWRKVSVARAAFPDRLAAEESRFFSLFKRLLTERIDFFSLRIPWAGAAESPASQRSNRRA